MRDSVNIDNSFTLKKDKNTLQSSSNVRSIDEPAVFDKENSESSIMPAQSDSQAANNPFSTRLNTDYDIIVVGDELESIIAALSAAKNSGNRIALVRYADENQPLGGLITRSGQTSLDRDFTNYRNNRPLNGEYERILRLAGVAPGDVSVDPQRLANVLENELRRNRISVISNARDIHPVLGNTDDDPEQEISNLQISDTSGQERSLSARVFIDTTPDGVLFRETNAPVLGNLRDLSPESFEEGNVGILAVSPIPNISGITFNDLDNLSQQVHRNGVDFSDIEGLQTEMGLSPEPNARRGSSASSKIVDSAVGLDFIHYMYQNYPEKAREMGLTYEEGGQTTVRGFNLSQIADGSINFNGLLFRPESVEQVQEMARGSEPDENMRFLSEKFAEYLQNRLGKPVTLNLPDELYVRDAGQQYATTNTRTAESLVRSEVDPQRTFATFSYANDFRGQVEPALDSLFFNRNGEPVRPEVQLSVDEGQSVNVDNLLGISQSIGSTPGAKGVSRIEQLMSIVAEAIGVRASLAAASSNMEPQDVPDNYVMDIMESRGYQPRPSRPIPVTTEEQRRLLERDNSLLQNALNGLI